MKQTYLAMILLGAALSASGQADAVNLNQRVFQTATNNCHASLPVFEGALRMRPLGITNDSEGTAFISCSMSINLAFGIKTVAINLINHGPDRDVSCTLVNGFPTAEPATFFPKTVALPTGVKTNIAWDAAAENAAGANFVWPNISCPLPPDVEVIFTRFEQDLDVGL